MEVIFSAENSWQNYLRLIKLNNLSMESNFDY